MRNKILPLILGTLLTTNFGFAQVCGTYEGSLEEQINKYPEFYQSLENKNTEIKMQHQKALSSMSNLKIENGKKIIPVVVHVIHNGGTENLTIAQIQNGINELNANINGQASNFLSVTPDIFAAVRGDLNVEFRLARIDPFGNLTSGVVRVQSELTVATVTATLSRDRVKSLSYWNSFQYFNIWVVKSMPAGPDPEQDPALNGYAQFPFPNPTFGNNMSTDGVMIRAGVFAVGETITHEVGHWLGLCHTWACGGGTCGTDNVADTPSDREGTFDFDGSFPFNVNVCPDPNGPSGEMYMNYMDYQSDAVQTMFTKGQNEVMNETLEGLLDATTNETGIGYREYMWSSENIIATGTADGYLPPFCEAKADFSTTNGVSSLCDGEQVILKGNKTQIGNNNVTAMLWDFGDGQTDDANNNLLTHTYNSVDTFDVTLTIEYNEKIEVKASDPSLLTGGVVTSESVDHMVQAGSFLELDTIGASSIEEIKLDSSDFYFGIEDSSYFRGYIQNVIYTATYNNTCTSSTTKVGFITVDSPTASSNASSYSYSFEDESELNGDWVLVQSTNIENQWGFNTAANDVNWQWENGTAYDGSSSIKVDADNMSSGGSTEIISKAYDLSTFTSPAIKFSWSGASSNTFPVNELAVTYSNDCGESWKSLGLIGAIESANAGLYSTSFKPNSSEWNSIVMTKSQLKDSNIRFKFEYIANGTSNNFYLDNIMIGEEVSLMVSELNINSKLSVFPNPAKGNATIILDNIADMNIDVSLINILGVKVTKLFSGMVISNYQEILTDLTAFEKGIYFIKVVSNGDVIMTDKLLIN